ncbi:5-formyltetrahydrofolate cyclo-ligase [Kaistia geumhonensis]|uniref:5-formyltetrahydrofolate cyclo-ligase n=1 Tax=Kaistia geumhonensis TaxID=410839 RepID=A0ABU0MAY1_9HYPH|nr:5-formyltetrahydrofolate cyclo-ligase [Kaistia geumhonensis]MCX5480908.1 5-formyltetrahydrofolate cyclo-ligase [Kaistia geumhonensis]MDQ0517965.1 5-formyltetrahydrofolate cyclo-ligase [Kaistia geumhonensis]
MSADTALLKSGLRAAALARRDALSEGHRAAASAAAVARAKPILVDLTGLVVSAYWPIRSEADPMPLLAVATERGAIAALPVTTPSGLVFRRWQHGEALVPAGFGTLGPSPASPEVTPDLMIMPLAAFDRRLHRIGYGKGHYDRAIDALAAKGRRPRLLGLAFAAQEVDKVPDEPHDIPLDFIVTEEELIAADHPGRVTGHGS